MAPVDPMTEIRASFFIECEELLEAMQDGLQMMDDGTADAEMVNTVFRAVHSIKGGAGAFGLEPIVRFAHRYETVLDAVRAGKVAVDPDLIKMFYRASDHLADLVRASRDDMDSPVAQGDALVVALDAYTGTDALPADDDPDIDFQPLRLDLSFDMEDAGDEAPPVPCFEIYFAPDTEMFENGNDASSILRALANLGDCNVVCDASKLPDLDKLAPETSYLSWTIHLVTDVDEAEIASIFEFVDGLCIYTISKTEAEITPPEDSATDITLLPDVADGGSPPSTVNPAPAPPSAEPPQNTARPTPPTPNPAQSVVRVDLDRIERLVNLVGELVINQAMLSQSLEQSGLSPHSDAMNGLEEFQRLTRDIQDSVMMIRAQPVKSLFQRMSRIVREASSAVDKDVRLHTFGESTEVDKTVIERLADPLTHMIRNAVDHGLETKEDRIAAGKPPQGSVNLTAAHRSGRVVIEISDDGAGINRPKVLQIAIDKGLIPPDAQLSDTEIDNLLFLPGFSTASVVSNLSGRGVGMDVVRTAIQALGGRITTTSSPGEGTSFSISLPLTLAVLDGMVVDVAGETLVLPLNLVIETLTLQEGDVEMVRPGSFVIEVRSGFVPLFDLGAALGYRAPLSSFGDAVVLLIALEDGGRAALVIDNILDQRQVVIKGLDDSFYRAPGIAAATILGDGQIALILDPTDIITNSSATGLAPPGAVPSGQTAGASA